MPNQEKYKILNKVKYPADIRELDVNDLKTLCGDIREYMIDVISQVGGHFGGGLGTVELTVALHKVFNTPHDALVWDTGHQAYPHKILTGRKDLLPTIRQLNGISGFLKRSESEYDVFGAGHASTSISAALGVATGAKKMGVEKKVVAIIGDGAMTGGMAYEALNNSGEGYRLPTMTELADLYNRSANEIDEKYFPDLPKSKYWTSSPLAGNDKKYWYLDCLGWFGRLEKACRIND